AAHRSASGRAVSAACRGEDGGVKAFATRLSDSSFKQLALTSSPGAMTVSNRAVHHHLDQFRAGTAECRRELRLQLAGLADPHRFQPERCGDAGKIHFWVDEIHADIMIVAVEREQPLLDNAVAAIIGDDDVERKLVMRRGP